MYVCILPCNLEETSNIIQKQQLFALLMPGEKSHYLNREKLNGGALTKCVLFLVSPSNDSMVDQHTIEPTPSNVGGSRRFTAHDMASSSCNVGRTTLLLPISGPHEELTAYYCHREDNSICLEIAAPALIGMTELTNRGVVHNKDNMAKNKHFVFVPLRTQAYVCTHMQSTHTHFKWENSTIGVERCRPAVSE